MLNYLIKRLPFFVLSCPVFAMPSSFVYLRQYDPSILQEVRYAGHHNFIGRPIAGYESNECILTKAAAIQLSKVQKELVQSGYSLKVYDGYRPQMAVNDFIQWSKDSKQQQMKAEFYPRVNKKDFFKLGYVAAKSSHSRGSTVDLTIIPLPILAQKAYHSGQKLTACYASYQQRFKDNSIDMGTGFDCMDKASHPLNKEDVSPTAYQNRMLLRNLMKKYGFAPYPKEWWHFTLIDEPYKNTYFNFPIKPIHYGSR